MHGLVRLPVLGLDREENQDQHREPDTTNREPEDTVALPGQEVLGSKGRDDLQRSRKTRRQCQVG